MSTTTKSKRVALGADVALSGSAAVIGDPFDCRNNTTVSLVLAWTKGASATVSQSAWAAATRSRPTNTGGGLGRR